MTHDAAQPVFSYGPDPRLLDVIVDAWLNRDYTFTPPGGIGLPIPFGPLRDALLERDRKGNPTPKAFSAATLKIGTALGVDLKRAVVISEAEHDNDYFMDDDEVVFVLPDQGRLIAGAIPNPPLPAVNPPRLVETAKLLMACTPNGI